MYPLKGFEMYRIYMNKRTQRCARIHCTVDANMISEGPANFYAHIQDGEGGGGTPETEREREM